MLRMRTANNNYLKPNPGVDDVEQPEEAQQDVLARLLASVQTLQAKVEEQQLEMDAQKDMVAKQREDTTKLHVNSYVHKTHQREMEIAEMEKYSNPNIKR